MRGEHVFTQSRRGRSRNNESLRARLGEEPPVDVVQVVWIEVLVGPSVAGREEPALRFGRLWLGGGRRLVAELRISLVAVEELEVIDEGERLDREGRNHLGVVDLEQVVAVVLLASKREVRRAAVDHWILRVESAHHE